ncbi:SRPBCC family protein [Thiohalorhabdus methylotrophus]|uniref:SRPBCC family protein n=1 Tax=Thiohalorhabdus methylotrophus TaxID=3242694 RepID=A0ABV4TRI7_9GAMM
MPDYDFSSEWRIEAPVQNVWDQIANPPLWPQWWPGCIQAVEVAPHRETGPGRRYRFQWRGRLPYRLPMEIELTEREPPRLLAGTVEGSLAGSAIWRLSGDEAQTRVGFQLAVDVQKPWMKRWVPLTQALFRWNFRTLMEEGRKGLGNQLDAATAPIE